MNNTLSHPSQSKLPRPKGLKKNPSRKFPFPPSPNFSELLKLRVAHVCRSSLPHHWLQSPLPPSDFRATVQPTVFAELLATAGKEVIVSSRETQQLPVILLHSQIHVLPGFTLEATSSPAELKNLTQPNLPPLRRLHHFLVWSNMQSLTQPHEPPLQELYLALPLQNNHHPQVFRPPATALAEVPSNAQQAMTVPPKQGHLLPELVYLSLCVLYPYPRLVPTSGATITSSDPQHLKQRRKRDLHP